MEAMNAVVGEEYCVVANEVEGRELTVRKTSIFSPGDGFEAYDHLTGDTLFRVETYDWGHALARTAEQLLLMDAVGATILTVRRKWPSLHQRWEGFLGEQQENQKPLFTVRRSSIFGDRSIIDVDVHGATPTVYRVEGSFGQRSCRVLYNGEQETVVAAEINRKVDTSTHVVMLGRDVFCLSVKPGFDAAFLMGVVVVLDQICSHDHSEDGVGGDGVKEVVVDVAND